MRQDQQQAQEKKEATSGNIWGWRFSLFGLALIVVLGLVIVFRHKMMNKPFDGWAPAEEQRDSLPADTTSSEKQ
ncbi:MAG: hypothetical protein IPN33_09755 [Saprospiraceae bacterium]|nr:hypothetical protein [Saprospiraceae bacterium]